METNRPRAIVFGSTGLVGSFLLEELATSTAYREVVAINRRASGSVAKVREIITAMDDPDRFNIGFEAGDHVFICLGTTIRKAGSVAAMDRIDRLLPVSIARKAHEGGATRLAVVSSVGADAGSRNYYLQIKGMMEAEIAELPFEGILILRPSILLGPRKEFRFGEAIGKFFMQVMNPLMLGPLRRYRGIHAATVAHAMQSAIGKGSGVRIIESEVIKML